ncbi:MAG: iron export ABC transporter permease subunit FetB [Candidatus Zixiibacteriota bacterium]|nr:MAG: iron export ABC transporter permease subunit FetB [candidate division Zixibacteria bacterium]HDL04632.1 iron export ABC transporter permease subunit FetB [candidate division Zixibacteria bacterium]
MIETGYLQVLASVALAIVALILTFTKSIPVEKEIAFGSVRAFVQLIAVGYALEFIFNSESFWLVLLSVAVMLMVGAYTAGQRAEHFKNGFWIALIAMGIGSLVTLGMMLALKIITVEARYIIPLAGMIISNSMNATAIAFNRIGSDLKSNKLAVETALSLGKNWKDASRRYYRNSVKAGMISILNFLKTVGLVALPGAMTGMILAGASPLDAVLIQLIVGYMLLLAVTISALISAEMSVRKFFNAAEQFVG